jgi:alpha-galactosidase
MKPCRWLPLLLAPTLLPACGGDEACVTAAGEAGSLTLALGDRCVRGTVMARRDGVWAAGDATAELAPDGDTGVRLVLTAPGPVEGLAVTLPGVDAQRVLQQGWQSWSWVGTVAIPAAVTLADDGLPAFPLPDSGDPVDEEQGVSYHAALLRRDDGGPVLAIAALRAELAATGIAAVDADGGDAADVTIVWGVQREGIAGDAGVVRSDPIYLAVAPDADQAMLALEDALAAEHAGDGFTPAAAPAGWYSWNERFVAIDEAYVADHVDRVAADLAPLGMDLVEVDDGWEVAWGDWTANAAFPSGMDALGASITGRGLTAGVWMAPFLVDVASQAAQGSPDLFVQGPDGQPLRHRLTGNQRTFYVLDGTNPDAMAIATVPIAALAAAGFTYFKLDFLYAGAFAGGRADDVTGIEALRRGLELVRDAAGPGAILEACGAPPLPVVGRADLLRFGADTAFDGFPLTFSYVGWMARSLAGRRYYAPVIGLDADQVQVRAPYSDVEARTGAVLTALAGPAYSLGDDLTVLPADRLAIALDPEVLDLAAAAEPARAVGLMDDVSLELVGSPILESIRAGGGVLVAPATRFEITGASGTRYTVEVAWNGDHAATVTTRCRRARRAARRAGRAARTACATRARVARAPADRWRARSRTAPAPTAGAHAARAPSRGRSSRASRRRRPRRRTAGRRVRRPAPPALPAPRSRGTPPRRGSAT